MALEVVVLFLVVPWSASFAQRIDDFSDGAINENLWTPEILGTGPAVVEQNQRLEISLPGASQDDPATATFAAGITTTCELQADFDVQVDYELLTWPNANGVRVGLVVGETLFPIPPRIQVQRNSLGSTSADYPGVTRENYSAVYTGAVHFSTQAHSSGRLRLVRIGNTATASFWDGSLWVHFPPGETLLTGPVSISLLAWSHDYTFSNQDVRISFDNFRVNSGSGCESPVPTEKISWSRIKTSPGDS